MSYVSLLSGSDLRGVAIPGDKPVTLSDEAAARAALCFARWLAATLPRRPLRIALGHDSRLSAPRLKAAMLRGFAAAGAVVLDCGLCTTPAMFMACVLPPQPADAAVMITASHLPAERNGIKFITKTGGLSSAQVRAIAQAMDECADVATAEGTVETTAFLPRYAAFLREVIQKGAGGQQPLRGLHIVLDAGSGAGGFFAADVLQALGANTEGSQYLQPDGHFPGHPPNPESPVAMQALGEAVRRAGADMGVIFDADADRAALCDSSGEELSRNRLVALCSAVVLEKHPGATIVTDSITSTGLADFIRARGGVHRRFKRGYRNVIDEAQRLCGEGADCPLAIETSGHAALRENYFLDDGAYLVSWLLVEAARLRARGLSLFDLIADLRQPAEAAEIRLSLTAPDFRAAGQTAIAALTGAATGRAGWSPAPDNFEGLRVNCSVDGKPDAAWFLVRLSVHDPVLPVNIESDVPGGVAQLQAELHRLLSACPGVDASPLLPR